MSKYDLSEFIKSFLLATSGSFLHVWIFPKKSKADYFISFCMSIVFGVVVFYVMYGIESVDRYAPIGCSAASILSKDLIQEIINVYRKKLRNFAEEEDSDEKQK